MKIKKITSFLILTFLLPILLAVFFPQDGPNSWTQLLSGATVFNDCIAINSTNTQIIYAGTSGAGVYKTTDGGATWVQSNTNLTDLNIQVLTISNSNPNILYAGGIAGGMFKSTDAAGTWAQINTGITELGKNVQCIAVKTNDPNTVVISLFDGVNNATVGVYKTTNGGTSWSGSNTGMLGCINFLSMATGTGAPNTIYIGSSFSASPALGPHIYKSYDFGSTWINISNGIDTTYTGTTGDDPFRDISISTSDTNTVLAARFWNSLSGGPYVTTNGGANWVQRSNGFGVTTAPGPLLRSCKIQPGTNNIFFVGGNAYTTSSVVGGVWMTTDAGLNWVRFNSGAMDSLKTIRSLNFRITPDITLYAGSAAGVTGVFAYTFIPPAPPPPVLVSPPNNAQNMPTTDSLIWQASAGATSYRVQLGTDSTFNTGIIVNDSTVTTTFRIVTGLNSSTVYYWHVNAKNSGGTSNYSGTWKFTTAGMCPFSCATPTTFTAISGTAGPTGDDAGVAAPIGFTFYYRGAQYTQVWICTNGFIQMGPTGITTFSNDIGSTNSGYQNMVAGFWDDLIASAGQIQYTTQGSSPNRVFICQFQNVPFLASSSSNVTFQIRLYEQPTGAGVVEIIYGPSTPYASATGSVGINVTPGGSGNFTSITPGSSGCSNTTFSTTVANNSLPSTNLTSGTHYIFCPLVGVNHEQNTVPTSYSLSQNYPNPFNPETQINYALPKASFVKIVVYDIRGAEIATLVNENKQAGYYSVKFNGTNFASGVYFYKVEAGSFIEVKKMVLLK